MQAPRSPSSGSALRCGFQLLNLGELPFCHLHHQIEDGFLSGCANLYELHARQSIPRQSVKPSPIGGRCLRHRGKEPAAQTDLARFADRAASPMQDFLHCAFIGATCFLTDIDGHRRIRL